MLNINITKKARNKLSYFTKLCDAEISGLGRAKVENGTLVIYDIELFQQIVSGASADLDENDLVKFLFEKTKAKQSTTDYVVWWHSHDNMRAYFSPIDESTIQQSSDFPYLISIVTNKDDDIEARLDIYKPIHLTIPLQLKVFEEEDLELKQQCEKEVKNKVKKLEIWQPQPKKRKKSTSKGKKKSLTPKMVHFKKISPSLA